jgi:hypothetical protein
MGLGESDRSLGLCLPDARDSCTRWDVSSGLAKKGGNFAAELVVIGEVRPLMGEWERCGSPSENLEKDGNSAPLSLFPLFIHRREYFVAFLYKQNIRVKIPDNDIQGLI